MTLGIARYKCSRCAVYLSELTLNGHVFPFTVAHPLQKADAAALPPATNAYMSGTFHLAGRSILVTAGELIPLYVSTTRATRAAAAELYTPYISLAGVVSSGRIIDVANPAALVVDVTVECTDRNPGHSTTIRCYFNRDERRFRTLLPLVLKTPVILSGKLFAWSGGKLAIDVDEVRCNNIGQMPSHPLALYPCPFAKCTVVHGYGTFPEAPPAYTPRSLPSISDASPMVIDVSESEDDDASRTDMADRAAEKLLARRAVVDRIVRARRSRRRELAFPRSPLIG